MIKYPGTEMWIPAVFGVKIPDPGGSGLMVPVLGLEPDWNTGLPAPLAGTMEDADGKGRADNWSIHHKAGGGSGCAIIGISCIVRIDKMH